MKTVMLIVEALLRKTESIVASVGGYTVEVAVHTAVAEVFDTAVAHMVAAKVFDMAVVHTAVAAAFDMIAARTVAARTVVAHTAEARTVAVHTAEVRIAVHTVAAHTVAEERPNVDNAAVSVENKKEEALTAHFASLSDPDMPRLEL